MKHTKHDGMVRGSLPSALALLLLAAGLLAACADGAADKVYMAAGSQGVPGDGAVSDLEPGSMYLLRSGRNWYPVKSDGTLGERLEQLNRPELSAALASKNLEPLASDVTGIAGLGKITVNVYKYWKPTDNFLVNAWNATGETDDVVATRQRNTVIDLSGLGAYSRTGANFGPDVIDSKSELIFVTPDVDNVPQVNTVYGGSPKITGGSEWEYLFDGDMANISGSRPLYVKVSGEFGRKGYFTLSGEMPFQFAMVSKRLSFDHDRPNPR